MKETQNKKGQEPYVEKIESLDALSERGDNGWCMMDDDVVLENYLERIIEQKGITVADLAKLTGISRQNINAVAKNKMKPGVDFALKVSYVLNVPIEEIFKLTAWMKPLRQERDEALFIDVVNLEIINNVAKKERLANDSNEYYHPETNTFYTRKQRDTLIREYVDNHVTAKVEEVKERTKDQKISINTINSIAIEELKNEFNEQYVKIYRKLGEQIEPYVLR